MTQLAIMPNNREDAVVKPFRAIVTGWRAVIRRYIVVPVRP